MRIELQKRNYNEKNVYGRYLRHQQIESLLFFHLYSKTSINIESPSIFHRYLNPSPQLTTSVEH